jgi:eukaryotic-like serine/threonine-protein kinase
MIKRIGKFLLLISIFCILAGISAYLTLSFIIKHEKRVVVPDLVGKNVVSALLLLSDLSLNTKVKGAEYSSDVPAHHIIFQDPPPGTEIKKDRSVRVVISKGTKSVTVPNLIGLRPLQAQIIMEENGLTLGNLSHTFDDEMESEVILAQSLPSGTVLNRSESVSLLVSLGKRPLSLLMPDLSAQSVEESIFLIEQCGLSLGKAKTVFDSTLPFDRIVDQSPKKGHRATQGEPVNIVINRRPGNRSSLLTKNSKLELFRYKLKPGFLNYHVRIRLNTFGISTDIIDAFLKPGEETWCFIPTQTGTTLFLYLDDELMKTKIYE